MTAGRRRFQPADLASLSDARLIRRLKSLIKGDRQLTARLLAHLAEVDGRKLYLKFACTSLHGYCTARLHMSDSEAYLRIQAARTARRFPRIFEMVTRNQLHLTGIALLAPHLTDANHADLLKAAVHASKREIQILLAVRFPRPDAPTVVRRLPRPTVPRQRESQLPLAPPPAMAHEAPGDTLPESTSTHFEPQRPVVLPTAPQRPIVLPTAPQRYKIQFTAGAALHDKLREAQALLRSEIPDGDIAEIFERALDGLLKDAKKKKYAATDRPRESSPSPRSRRRSRRIPNAVKRAVFARDSGQCTYVDGDGNRCPATSLIEFHHLDAFARGGGHTVDNLTLRCAGHNRLAAEEEFGRDVVAARTKAARDNRKQVVPALSGRSPSPTSGQNPAAVSGQSSAFEGSLLTPSKVREGRPSSFYAVMRRERAPTGGDFVRGLSEGATKRSP